MKHLLAGLRSLVLTGSRTITHWAPLFSLRLLKSQLILTYHAAGAPVRHIAHYSYKNCTEFEQDLVYIRRYLRPINYDQLKAGGYHPGSVLLTVDDGLTQCYESMRPLLLKYDIPCVFFICRDFVENRMIFFETQTALCLNAYRQSAVERQREVASILQLPEHSDSQATESAILALKDHPVISSLCELLDINPREYIAVSPPFMSEAQVKQLSRDGFTLGAHSCTHPKMNELPPVELEREIIDSVRYVQMITGQEKIPFAFPWSSKGVNRADLQRIRGLCPELDLMFDTQGLLPNEAHLLNRVAADPPAGQASRSNLPAIIGRSCHNEFLRRAHNWLHH